MSKEHKAAEKAASAELVTVNEEIAELADWEITDEEDLALAGEMLADVKGRLKRLEAKRKEITGPMNKALKAVNNLFREPKERLGEAERMLKGGIAGYMSRVAESNDDAYAEAGEAETTQEAVNALEKVRDVTAPKGISIRHTWVPVIVDENKVPQHLCSPDISKIKAEMAGKVFTDTGEPVPIAGVRFERKDIVSSRSA